ncbi:MAG: hypothetical protein OXL37_14200 [Chloroflexota bacterium]|nr:hypothetical protein [Chloroflexota bacterium]MDE2961555.1 hypothetical protein [Chloroflexota bacterium]
MATGPTFREADVAAAVALALAASKDPAQPAADVGRSPVKYAQLSHDFRASAWRHLNEDGDLPQASSKAWGMVAETIKAVSARHGGIIHAHRSIWHVLRELSNLAGESGDIDTANWLRNSFGVARTLHSNFYEDEADAGDVIAGLLLCEELSDRLYELFWPDRATGETGLDNEG